MVVSVSVTSSVGKICRYGKASEKILPAIVDAKELCAVIAALYRLQVSCLDDVLAKVTNFAVEQAKNDVMMLEGQLDSIKRESEKEKKE